MIDGNTLPEGEPIYVFVQEDGTNICIHAERLRQWCIRNKLKPQLVPVDFKLGQSYLQDGIVTLDRCLDLLVRGANDPIIMCRRGTYTNGAPDMMHVDGHHRYALAAMMKRRYIKSYVLWTHQWRRFQITNLPQVTQDQLLNAPTKKRDY